MISLRVTEPRYLDILRYDRQTKQFVGRYATVVNEVYYYLHRLNITYVPMKVNFLQISKSGGVEVLQALEDDVIDMNMFASRSLEFLTPNVTTGPTAAVIDCRIITFPKIDKLEKSSFVFEPLFMVHPSVFIFLLLFGISLMYLSSLLVPSAKLSHLYWSVFLSIIRQRYIYFRLKKIRMLLFTLMATMLVLNIPIGCLIRVERIEIDQYRQVDSFEDIVKYSLGTAFRDDGRCYPFIERNSDYKDFLMLHRLNIGEYNGQTVSLLPLLLNKVTKDSEISSMAALLDIANYLGERNRLCIEKPEFIKTHPPRLSKISFANLLEPVTFNKRLGNQVIRKLSVLISSVLEGNMDLVRSPFIRLSALLASIPVDISCLDSKEKQSQQSPEALKVSYFLPLGFMLLFVYVISTIIFVHEIKPPI